MASSFSFDIVSEIDHQLIRNAVDNSVREIITRYDFKGSKSSLELKEEGSSTSIIAVGDDEFKLSQLHELLKGKLVKQDIDLKFIDWDKKAEPASQGTLRQELTVKQGLTQEHAKEISKSIRDAGFKVKAQIQGEAIRVTSASKDDLQKVIAHIKGGEWPVALSFTNYR